MSKLSEQERGAAIGMFAASVVNMDFSLRKIQEAGLVRQQLKQQLNVLQGHVDKFLVASQRTFNLEDADTVNALSEVINTASFLLLQLTPAQIEDSLKMMESYARLNEIEAKYPAVA